MRRSGFTLVEIMIVVGIIVLLAAVAIPNLLRSRMNANESAAISAMRTISSAAVGFRATNSAYPVSLGALSSTTPPYIDAVLSAGNKSGYSFTLSGDINNFNVTAWPQNANVSGVRTFFVDETGVIRWSLGGANATNASSSLD